MWYIAQLIMIAYIGYTWTTMPGHTPDQLGHGLFIGAVIAWWVTAVYYALRDAISGFKQRSRVARSKPAMRRSLLTGRPLLINPIRHLSDRRRE